MGPSYRIRKLGFELRVVTWRSPCWEPLYQDFPFSFPSFCWWDHSTPSICVTPLLSSEPPNFSQVLKPTCVCLPQSPDWESSSKHPTEVPSERPCWPCPRGTRKMAVRVPAAAASLSEFQIASVKRIANSKHMLPGQPHPRCARLVGAPFSKEPEYQNQAQGTRWQSRWREAHRPRSLPGQGSVGLAVLKHLGLTFSVNTRRA